jgi:hypothetical protein
MVFNYEWSDSKNGNFAIRKRSTRGIEAGKEIEIKKNQTSTTHFFILVDKDSIISMSNLYRINQILKTIEYDYRQKGTDKKSGTKYLTKEDIEDVLNNIDQYKNKTIKIETASSRAIERDKIKKEKDVMKNWEKVLNKLLDIDKKSLKDINNFLVENLKNDKELKLKKQKLKIRIIKFKENIKKANTDILEFEKNIQTRKKENEKKVYSIIEKALKFLSSFDDSKTLNFTDFLNVVLYKLAKKEIKNRKARAIQKRYRDNKNEKNGIPKRKRGRPRKTEK